MEKIKNEQLFVKAEAMPLFNWCANRKEWVVRCPKCGKPIDLTDTRHYELNNSIVTLKCGQGEHDKCSFIMDIPWMWHKIHSAKVVKDLVYNIPHMDTRKAWIWVNEFKYTNPTYYLGQNEERGTCDSLQRIPITNIIRRSDNILIVGSNSNREIDSLKQLNYNKVVCLDISKKILDYGQQMLKLRLAGENSDVFSKIWYAEGFVEDLYDCEIEPYQENNTPYPDREVKFNLCVALKLFQSAYFTKDKMRKSLIGIAAKLHKDGYLIISIPKQTAYLSEEQNVIAGQPLFLNRIMGIYNEATGFSIDVNKLELIKNEIMEIGLYDNVTVYYGDENSYEYFITCTKK